MTDASDSDEQSGPGLVRRIVYGGLLLFAVIAGLTAGLPLLDVNYWWVRIWDYPRTQLLAAYGLIATGLWFFRNRKPAAVGLCGLLAACVIQMIAIAPYLPVAPREVQSSREDADAPSIRVVACNVLQENSDYESIQKVIADANPDVLLLLEVDDVWLSKLSSLKADFLHHTLVPLSNKYGMAFYSNLPVASSEVRHYISDEIPSIVADVKLSDGTSIRLFGVHPNPPRPGEDTTKRDAELILVGRDVKEHGGPSLVFGDMNDVGWSRTTNLFQEVSGLLDPRKGRGFYSTFDAESAWLRYPLDYLFHSDDFRLQRIERLPFVGSDHFPLLIELSYEPEASSEQEGPDLDAEDKEDAEDAVDEAADEKREADTDMSENDGGTE